MRFTINVEKMFAYAIVGAMLILVGLIAVTAYGTSNPQVFGHSASEIGPGAFDGDIDSLYSFPGGVNIAGDLNTQGDLTIAASKGLTLGGVKKTSWPVSSQGCSWSGWKCHCNSDTQGTTQIDITVGLECSNGAVNDIRVASQPHTSVGSSAGCPATGPAWCTVYTAGGF